MKLEAIRKFIVTGSRSFVIELMIVLVLIFSVTRYMGPVENTLGADGGGYYDYLPSLFIHHDFVRKGISESDNPALYGRIKSIEAYGRPADFRVNKYSCGTAILELPFFAWALLTTELDGDYRDGYQKPFQKCILYAALFYLFLGLIFIRKLLELFEVRRWVIVFCQLILVLGTNLTHYTTFDGGFSHVFSLFAISAFLYYAKSYFIHHTKKSFIFSVIFLGLIFILRIPNVLIVLFLPFLAGSWDNFRSGVLGMLNWSKLSTAFLLFGMFACIQPILWYLQSGHLLVDSYPGESFNFTHPEIISILFSYRKGLFIYTPLLMVMTFGLFWLGWKKKWYLIGTWLLFFSAVTYLLASWWSWFYGCSFGLRAYIEFYPVFLIPFAIAIGNLQRPVSIGIIALALVCIPVNFIQNYQYTRYILHWMDMNKELYWKVFLKTHEKYNGLIWKENFNPEDYEILSDTLIGDVNAGGKGISQICNMSSLDIENFESLQSIQISFENDFSDRDNSRIILEIFNTKDSSSVFRHDPYIIQFHESELNQYQEGQYHYKLSPWRDSLEKSIVVSVKTRNQDVRLRNFQIRYLKNR